jgi:hypothetical protein
MQARLEPLNGFASRGARKTPDDPADLPSGSDFASGTSHNATSERRESRDPFHSQDEDWTSAPNYFLQEKLSAACR